MRKTSALFLLPLALLAMRAASAEDSWSGRSEIGFVAAHGNSSTNTANAKLEIVRAIDKWKYTLAATGLYGKSEGIVTAQRVDGRFQTDYLFSRKAFWFGAGRYEDDRYSGFDYQGSLTSGVGYKFADTNATKFSVQVGAGYRALRPELLVKDDTGAVVQRILGERQKDFVTNGAVSYSHAITDTTRVIDNFLVESGESNTLTRNDFSLEVSIMKSLALSLGVSVRRNSQPLPGLKSTDTLTTANLVYSRSSKD